MLYKYFQECCNQTIKDYNGILTREEEIAKLKRKIDSFSDVITERNELREQCKKNERWMEDSESEHKKVFAELLNTFNVQTEKLKKVMSGESKWQEKYDILQECYNRTNNELNAVKSNENKLQCKADKCEINSKCVGKELSCTKVSNCFI